jgi:predicted DNA-binding transcriptional regulator YafY
MLHYDRLFQPGTEVEFSYVDESGAETRRVVKVERTWPEKGNFAGWCYLRNDWRMFHLSGVVEDTARIWDGFPIIDTETGELLVAERAETVRLRNAAEGWLVMPR